MEINPRTNREYSMTDMRSIESQAMDQSDSFNIYNGNVLVEYTLVDQLNGNWGVFFIITALMVTPSLIILHFIKNKINFN